MSVPRSAAAFVLASAVAIAALVWVLRRGPAASAGASPLRYIPDGAMLVASARLDRLRSSPVTAPFVREGRALPGMGPITDLCGFDPVAHLEQIAIAVPKAGEEADVGIVATGPLEALPLLACASRIIERRGGTAIRETKGTFSIVHDASSDHRGQLAVRDGGPVLVGAGTYLASMIDTAEGRAPSVLANRQHAALRERLKVDSAVAVTLLLSPAMRERAREELQGAPGKWTTVVAAALSVVTGASIGFDAQLSCETEDDCTALGGATRAWKDAMTGSLALRGLGVAPIVERLRIATAKAQMSVSGEVRPEEATELLARLESFGKDAPGAESEGKESAGPPPNPPTRAGAR